MELTKIRQQMQFLIEIDKLKNILRRNYLADGLRRENDAEHSWHLAMMVLILAEHFDEINLIKTVKMVLIHDLVEIYAGDTFAYDEEGHLDKDEREQKAAARIFPLLPAEQAAEYIDIWQEFERMDTREALCAAIVDRLQPLTLNTCSKGRLWQEHSVTVGQVKGRAQIIFDHAPEVIAQYARDLIDDSYRKGYFENQK